MSLKDNLRVYILQEQAACLRVPLLLDHIHLKQCRHCVSLSYRRHICKLSLLTRQPILGIPSYLAQILGQLWCTLKLQSQLYLRAFRNGIHLMAIQK